MLTIFYTIFFILCSYLQGKIVEKRIKKSDEVLFCAHQRMNEIHEQISTLRLS